ncbi:hypothetical protein D3C80_1243790 [compost metagenome]
MTARLNRRTPLDQLRGVAAIQRIAQQSQLFTFLQGEGEPAFHFCIQSRFDTQIDRAVQQRARRGNPQIAFAHDVFNLRVFLGQIGAPDVTPVHQARRQQPVGRQAFVEFSDIIFTVNQIHVQTLHWQRGDGVEIRRDAFEIGGQQQFGLAR